MKTLSSLSHVLNLCTCTQCDMWLFMLLFSIVHIVVFQRQTNCLSLPFVTFFQNSLQLTFCIIICFQVIFQISPLSCFRVSIFLANAHAPCHVIAYCMDHKCLRTPFSPGSVLLTALPSIGSKGSSMHARVKFNG
jgi:hypothetical protein